MPRYESGHDNTFLRKVPSRRDIDAQATALQPYAKGVQPVTQLTGRFDPQTPADRRARGDEKQYLNNLKMKEHLDKVLAEKIQKSQAKDKARAMWTHQREEKQNQLIETKLLEDQALREMEEANRLARVMDYDGNNERLKAIRLSRPHEAPFLGVTETFGRKMRFKSIAYCAQPPERFHIPTGYDGRVPMPTMDGSTLIPGAVYTDNLKWDVPSKVHEAYTSNLNHQPRPSPFKVFSEPRSKVPEDKRRPPSLHERSCKTCKKKACKHVKKGSKLAADLEQAHAAHASCWKEMGYLTRQLRELRGDHAPCDARHAALNQKYEKLASDHAPCEARIAELRSIAKEHEACEGTIFGHINEMNQVKAEIKAAKQKLEDTQAEFFAEQNKHQKKSESHLPCPLHLSPLWDLQHAVDRTIETCQNYQPSIGLQLMEFAGDGIAVKLVPEDLPAYQAGLRQFDMIIESNGVKIYSKADFKKSIADCVAGDEVSILVRRGKGHTVVVLVIGAAGATVDAVLRNRKLADYTTQGAWRAKATKYVAVENQSTAPQYQYTPRHAPPTPRHDGSMQKDPENDLAAYNGVMDHLEGEMLH